MKSRSIVSLLLLWAALAFSAAVPAQAEESGASYRAALNNLQLEMRAMWGELDRFQVQPSYCQPPYGPIKQPDEMVMTALSQRADALNARYIALKGDVLHFLGGNHRLAAELMLNGSDPLDPQWWRRYDEGRDRMLQERNRKRDALARAPVRNCAPTPPQQPQPVADTPALSLPQPPTYVAADFPTVPRQFCSEAEYWRFINEVMDPPYIRAAQNAEKAAKFRTAIEVQTNNYVQAGKPVPAALRALRQRAQRESAERDRLSAEIAKLRDRAVRTPIVDCSKTENTTPRIGSRLPNFPMPGDMNGKLWRVYGEFEDARERCDRAAMAAALAELADLAREARDAYNGIADSLQGGPFDQDESPENVAYWSAEADMRAAERMLAGARVLQAKACPPCTDQPPPVTSTAAAPAPSAVNRDAAEAVAQWVVETDRLFDSMAQATQARDCVRIKAAMNQIAQRFGGPRRIWWAAGVPLEILAKWKWLYIRAAEACRPPADPPESILDEIEEVPVIAMTTAPNAFAQAFLDYHNRLRAEVGAPPVRWNPILAAHAAAYALIMTQTGQLMHSTRQGREKERENVTLGRHGTSSPSAMMETWGREKSLYRPGLFPTVCAGDWSTCAHYTQMIWSTTTDVGCGFVSGHQYDALVCRYSPPGNADGKPVILPPDQLAIIRRCPPIPQPPPPPPPPP